MEKYIFLDFNGTVLDDVNLCFDILNEMLIKTGEKPVSIAKYKEIFCFPVKDYYVKAGLNLAKFPFSDLADYYINEYTKRYKEECYIFPDVIEFVNSVKEKGYKVILFSASKKEILLEQLKAFGIDNVFDDVIALSNHHANSKLALAIEYLEINKITKENVTFIGDTDHDALVGKNCKGNIILVSRGHQNMSVLAKTKQKVVKSLKECINLLI